MKAIETSYKGYRFRSRLEARWAIFFDSLKLKWEYEGQGYYVGSERYLPDFWVSTWNCFVEIKPNETVAQDRGERMCKLLSLETTDPVLLITGNPWKGEHKVTVFKNGQPIFTGQFADAEHASFTGCAIVSRKNGYPLGRQKGVSKALLAARSARFEHGENR